MTDATVIDHDHTVPTTDTTHVGIAIGPVTITVAEVSNGPHGPLLTRFGAAPTPDGAFSGGHPADADTLGRGIAAAMMFTNPTPGSTVHVAVSGPAVSRTVKPEPTGNPGRDERATKAAHYGLNERQIAAYDTKLQPGKGMTIGPKPVIGMIREVLASGNIPTTAIIPAGIAAAAGMPPTPGTCGLLVVEGDSVTGTILADNDPLIVRTIDGLGRAGAVRTWLRDGRIDTAAASSMAKASEDLARRIIGISPVPGQRIYVAGDAATYPGVIDGLNAAMPDNVSVQLVEGVADHIAGPVALTDDERATVGPRLLTALGAARLGAHGNTATLRG